MKNTLTREWSSWGEYVRCLYFGFGIELFNDPMGDFKDLRQVSSVQDYVDAFDKLLTRVELAYEYAVSCFIRDLKPEIGLPIKMFAPRLQRVINQARIQEQTLILHHQPSKNTNFPVFPNPRTNHKNPAFSQPTTKILHSLNQPPANHLPNQPTHICQIST